MPALESPSTHNTHKTPSTDTARLYLPRPSLAHCLRGTLVRDTRGVTLTDAQRFNFFPATPYCAITWFLEGESLEVQDGTRHYADSPRTPYRARILFSGPFSQPYVSWSTGPLYCFMLGWMPQAAQALMGLDPGVYANKVVPASEVMSPEWLDWCHRVRDAADDQARIQFIEATLEPKWQALRPEGMPGSQLVEDWAQHLATRAATSGLGRSLRQVERRIKQWTGMPLRELKGMGKLERAFFETLLAMETGTDKWSDVAEEAGYTDQSHLCRQTRRLTGFAPDDLRRRIAEDEGFWSYRVWGFQEQARKAPR
ncbi:MAG TPA: AraC family transcriptional regulator [Aquabacterium sp.]|uniref:helix-turn-helix domain-containing protein n=1 Tax=Aquabacterium sp. TaxID=1872578 RepID=UPI002E2F93AC|nr:AraC family transcriptional regulator [Aquabacterium sp.]HEX5356059.1 AraC family transcriptional regulator [Aquabacterium sp.]